MNNQELRELVNPVFNTAKSCVQLNAAAGDRDAQRLLDALGFPPFGAQMSKKPVPREMLDQIRKLFPAYTILIETRFQAMNRRYTHAHYLSLVEKLRKTCPDIGLTSDIIVGFPGETLEQFEETLALVRQVRFDAAYTFIFSPRQGTRAAELPDDTPESVKSERIQRLIELQQAITLETLKAQVGRTESVLVEAVSTRDEHQIGGKTPRGHMVNFPGDPSLIGRFVDVEITSAGRNTLRGRIIGEK